MGDQATRPSGAARAAAREQRTRERIAEIVAKAPPLTDQQIRRLAALFGPVRAEQKGAA